MVEAASSESYDQKRISFQGFEQDVILGWTDEEPPLDIFSECLLRTMTTGGIVMLTFTPLQGITALIKHLRAVGAWEIGLTWDDVPSPHGQGQEAAILKDTPAYLRDARSKGVPLLGSGGVFTSPRTIKVGASPAPFRTGGAASTGWTSAGITRPRAWSSGTTPRPTSSRVSKVAREREMIAGALRRTR
jgi:phage terminase large subunit-like protein